eukprot:TRINITY_DN3204_c0_g3_i7.p1 TRINITY_DN3204_c0_g3~~TRINITY_DN3204_c0_g3_i7.p1  ORF type:complete len:332 (-),score=24.09 TRINITY_DN3204_c0_g3_i7:26-1021(-)
MVSVPPEVTEDPEDLDSIESPREAPVEAEAIVDYQSNKGENNLEASLLQIKISDHRSTSQHKASLIASHASRVSNLSVMVHLSDTCFWKRGVFWQLYFLQFTSLLPGLYFAFNYRSYGLFKFNDDKLMAYVGGISMLCNGASGPCWGVLFDSFGFKRVMLLIILLQFAVLECLTYLQDPMLYLAAVSAVLVCEGGVYVSCNTETLRVFGINYGARVMPVVSLSGQVAFLLILLMNQYIVPSFGFRISFMGFMGIVQVLGLIVCLVYDNRVIVQTDATSHYEDRKEFASFLQSTNVQPGVASQRIDGPSISLVPQCLQVNFNVFIQSPCTLR